MSSAIPNRMSTPWSKIETPIVNSLKDVMSEQLVNELYETEVKSFQDVVVIDNASSNNSICEATNDAIDNDYVLASLLQLEFDKEYDEVLKGYENQRNRNSKGKLFLF